MSQRQSWEDRQAKRIAAKREQITDYRRRVGIRTVEPEHRLPFACGVEDCWKSLGHTGPHDGPESPE